MLKHISAIFFPFFTSAELWRSSRYTLLFRNESQLQRFQTSALRFILKHHNLRHLSDVQPSDRLPTPHPSTGGVILRRSGTTDSRTIQREYLYSWPECPLIEDHHIWRIEESHRLCEPGSVLNIVYHPFPHDQQSRMVKLRHPKVAMTYDCCIYGPYQISSLGSHNQVYFWYFNENTDERIWRYNLALARKMNLKMAQLTPSTLELLSTYADNTLPIPCIVTGETLYERARTNGLFSKLIDKMRCWDGGLSWFECAAGRKHVYDELCYVENHSGVMACTDLHNRAMPFIRYVNHDSGTLFCDICNCGVYGNYFAEFQGKEMEAIIVNGKVIPGSVLYNIIGAYLRNGRYNFDGSNEDIKKYRFSQWVVRDNPFDNVRVLWRLHQTSDGNVCFRYFSDIQLNDFQKSCLQDMLDFAIYRHESRVHIEAESKESFLFRPHARSKSLSVTSDILRYKRTE
jgi:hypothetical protein